MTLTAEPTVRPVQQETGENNLFPVFLKLDQLRVILIGGGNVALEKLQAIVRTTATRRVDIVAPDIAQAVYTLAGTAEGVRIHQRYYDPSDLDDTDLVICAVNEPELSAAICRDARQRGLLINVADKPDLCDFYLGSIVHKGHLKIAISTNGQSPTLAKRMREVLSAGIPDEFDDLLQSINILRKRLNGDFASRVLYLNELTQSLVSDRAPKPQRSERFWKRIAYGCIAALFILIGGNVLAHYATADDIRYSLDYIRNEVPKEFYLMLLTGFLAQLVDGALGMGYGVTCTSILLALGVPLPAISGGIHTAEMFSSGASGLSHYKFGNVNKKLFKIIVIPGVIGSFLGAYVLARFGQEHAAYFRPLLACYTLFLGLKITTNAFRKNLRRHKLKRVGLLGFSGGFLDSIGGGGWGPLITSTLISKGKSPKYVVGTVSLTEFFVTLVSALTFFVMLGISHWQVITGLIIGGLVASPLSARLSGKLPRKAGFICVGLLIIIWSLNILFRLL